MTWDRWLYFPYEGRRAEDFFALKNPTASAGFQPANLGTKGQHATPRPPKPLILYVPDKFHWTLPSSKMEPPPSKTIWTMFHFSKHSTHNSEEILVFSSSIFRYFPSQSNLHTFIPTSNFRNSKSLLERNQSHAVAVEPPVVCFEAQTSVSRAPCARERCYSEATSCISNTVKQLLSHRIRQNP